jgi:phosphatidate phosphatase PAH1
MTKIETTLHKLILKAGLTTLTLDKDTGKATLQQKMLLWSKKPIEFALSDIDDIAVKSDVDAL